MSAAGTSYFPDLENKILLIENMAVSLSTEERNLRHLERLGVFEVISGLIVGKPEIYNNEEAPFDYEQLVLEIVGSSRKYPIVTEFDCGHTNPTLTIGELTKMRVLVGKEFQVEVTLLEPMVEE